MMHSDNESDSVAHDKFLASQFDQLRRAESNTAPTAPLPEVLRAAVADTATNEPAVVSSKGRDGLRFDTASVNGGRASWLHPTMLPRVAAALAVIAISTTWVMNSATEDPARLYVQIMDGQSMTTDSLLDVSDAVLPALSTLPTLYEVSEEYDWSNDSALDSNFDGFTR